MKILLALAAFGPTAGVAAWTLTHFGGAVTLQDAACILETGADLSAGPVLLVGGALIIQQLQKRQAARAAQLLDARIVPAI